MWILWFLPQCAMCMVEKQPIQKATLFGLYWKIALNFKLLHVELLTLYRFSSGAFLNWCIPLQNSTPSLTPSASPSSSTSSIRKPGPPPPPPAAATPNKPNVAPPPPPPQNSKPKHPTAKPPPPPPVGKPAMRTRSFNRGNMTSEAAEEPMPTPPTRTISQQQQNSMTMPNRRGPQSRPSLANMGPKPTPTRNIKPPSAPPPPPHRTQPAPPPPSMQNYAKVKFRAF